MGPSGLDAIFTIDGFLTCNVSLVGLIPASGNWELMRKDDTLQLIAKSHGKPVVHRIFQVGQTITVEGLFSRKPDGKVRLKGILRR